VVGNAPVKSLMTQRNASRPDLCQKKGIVVPQRTVSLNPHKKSIQEPKNIKVNTSNFTAKVKQLQLKAKEE